MAATPEPNAQAGGVSPEPAPWTEAYDRGVRVDDDPRRPLRWAEPGALRRCAALTARECEILEVLATGATTDEAAHRLRLSSDEVRAHVQHSMQTLQARSKLEAVLLALRADVIREPQE